MPVSHDDVAELRSCSYSARSNEKADSRKSGEIQVVSRAERLAGQHLCSVCRPTPLSA
jgi:hypothetical protein